MSGRLAQVSREARFYEEHENSTRHASDLRGVTDVQRVRHITMSDEYEAIDVYKERLDLLHAPKILVRSRKK